MTVQLLLSSCGEAEELALRGPLPVLVRPENRTPLPSEGVQASKRTWKRGGGRQGESSAAASSGGAGPQASAAPPERAAALNLAPEVVTYERDEEEAKVKAPEDDEGSHAATVPGSEDANFEEGDFDPPDEPGTQAKEEENPQNDGSA